MQNIGEIMQKRLEHNIWPHNIWAFCIKISSSLQVVRKANLSNVVDAFRVVEANEANAVQSVEHNRECDYELQTEMVILEGRVCWICLRANKLQDAHEYDRIE